VYNMPIWLVNLTHALYRGLMSKIKSEFAILDVLSKSERKKLQDRLMGQPDGIPIIITGRLVRVWGDHDGVSQEYEVTVEEVLTSSR
jgi:hypothetical protein